MGSQKPTGGNYLPQEFKSRQVLYAANLNYMEDGIAFNHDAANWLYTNKQDLLVSGTNIKTINGQSILGGGDIVITASSEEGEGSVGSAALANYLPLAGGTMIGDLEMRVVNNGVGGKVGGNIKAPGSDSRILVMGANSQSQGAYIAVGGEDNASYPGSVYFRALNGGNSTSVELFADGRFELVRNEDIDNPETILTTSTGIDVSGASMMEGTFVTANEESFARNVNSSRMTIRGGVSGVKNSGAVLELVGSESTKEPGVFKLTAYDDKAKTSKTLLGKATAALTWGGTEILTVAGGKMTGGLVFTTSNAISQSGNSNSLSIYGGNASTSSNTYGAYMTLYGMNTPNTSGYAQIVASKGSQSSTLDLTPSGSMKWGGKEVVRRVNNTTPGPDGNITLDNNVINQIIGGQPVISVGGKTGRDISLDEWSLKEEVLAAARKATAVSVGVVGATNADIEALRKAVTRVEAEIGDLPNTITRVVSTWSNGNNWYRKWSDGWIEQGGRSATQVSGYTYKVNFHTPFTTTRYSLIHMPIYSGVNTPDSITYGRDDSLTTTSATIGTLSSAVFWYACGY